MPRRWFCSTVLLPERADALITRRGTRRRLAIINFPTRLMGAASQLNGNSFGTVWCSPCSDNLLTECVWSYHGDWTLRLSLAAAHWTSTRWRCRVPSSSQVVLHRFDKIVGRFEEQLVSMYCILQPRLSCGFPNGWFWRVAKPSHRDQLMKRRDTEGLRHHDNSHHAIHY